MRRPIFVCSLLLLLAGAGRTQPSQPVESNEREETFAKQSVKTFSGSYLLYLPDHYAQEPQKTWPVLLYLHSYDARGQDLQKLKQEGLPSVLRTGKKLPFIVVAPLCPLDDWWDSRWSVENVNVLLDELLEKYRGDASRVYLTGWSMGGAGTWRLASSYPTRFAAIAPVSARGQTRYVASLKNTPVWAFHGDEDTTVPLGESQKMVSALQSIGGNVQLTVLPHTDHDAWPQVYNKPELYDWLLKYSTKGPVKTTPPA